MATAVSREQSDILSAFQGKNKRVPVWFMRQAGRYLPQYQALKGNRPLGELFRDPEAAGAITLQPLEILGVDAAILFADILTMPSAMGFRIDFINGKGPVVANPVHHYRDLRRLGKFSGLDYLTRTIQLINLVLPPSIPLIGFAGSPYTVATYLCSRHNHMMYENPTAFHQLMALLTDNTIAYLKQQKEAGIKLFQLFDTWAGSLRREDYESFVLPYVQKIFKAVNLPSIYYLKNCAHLMGPMEKSGAEFLSVCETVNIKDIRSKKGIQGNLLNTLLYADDKTLIEETRAILKSAKARHRRYIFNLSHGVMPDVNPLKLKMVVDEVHKFKWK
ncbi:MAG: uroporphyrinogen decarboxylase [Candidatus Omnitrophica bacterium]|nr:uroporphyrinogen decarboxylase [Candidatus Omnitrophota bacterium]MDE2009661.1 uroporphyrinogen decarboxylase [Candidatus Omnitrophota bacterium]MDE2214411.1 uroporphyrinogen decarboxylase [Candidatus Omnitrophota bacterium]